MMLVNANENFNISSYLHAKCNMESWDILKAFRKLQRLRYTSINFCTNEKQFFAIILLKFLYISVKFTLKEVNVYFPLRVVCLYIHQPDFNYVYLYSVLWHPKKTISKIICDYNLNLNIHSCLVLHPTTINFH